MSNNQEKNKHNDMILLQLFHAYKQQLLLLDLQNKDIISLQENEKKL